MDKPDARICGFEAVGLSRRLSGSRVLRRRHEKSRFFWNWEVPLYSGWNLNLFCPTQSFKYQGTSTFYYSAAELTGLACTLNGCKKLAYIAGLFVSGCFSPTTTSPPAMQFSTKPFFKKQNEILNLADTPTQNQRKVGKRVLPIDVTLIPVEFTRMPPSGFRGRKSLKRLFKSFHRTRAATTKHAAERSHASRWRATPFTRHKAPATSKDTPRRQSRLFQGGSEFTRLEVRKLRQAVEESVDGPRRTRFMIHWDGLLLLESSDAGTNASVDSATIDTSGLQDGAVDAGAVDAGAVSTVQDGAMNAEPVSTNHSGASSAGASHSTGVGSTVRFADQVSLPAAEKRSSVDAGKTSSTVPVCAAVSAQSNSPDRSGPQDPQCSPPQTQQTQRTQQKQHQPRPLGLKLIRVVAPTADKFPKKAAADFGSAGPAGPSSPGSAFALAPVRWACRLGARAARFTSAVREDWAFRRQERRTTREVKKQEKNLHRLEAERLFDSLVSRARAAAFECVHADLDQKAAAACQLQQARQAVYALHAQRRVAHAKAKAEAKETKKTEKAPKATAPLSPRPSNSPSISPRALRSTAASSVSCRHCLLCLQCRSSLHCHVCGRKRPLAA